MSEPIEPVLLLGDCVETMRGMEPNSIDAIVCDPPYGLEFMGKGWDRLSAPTGGATFTEDGMGKGFAALPSFGGNPNPSCINCGGSQRGQDRVGFTRCRCDSPEFPDTRGNQARAMQEWHEVWALEALRVLKPGGHLLAFGGTRTFHRLACAVEDAGFEIRDHITHLVWVYGSGFPKSLDVSKAIDKAAGAQREVVGRRTDGPSSWMLEQKLQHRAEGGTGLGYADGSGKEYDVTAPSTPEAQQWSGWGTALKPAHEPIVLARKPLIGNVATNVLTYGTGALNIDGCRVSTGDSLGGGAETVTRTDQKGNEGWTRPWMEDAEAQEGHAERVRANVVKAEQLCRWPSNLLLSHSPECELVGTKQIKAITGTSAGRMKPGWSSEVYGTYAGDPDKAGAPTGYGDDDGMETVEAWNCAEGCPVAELDAQSGDRPAGGRVRGTEPSRTGSHGIYNDYGARNVHEPREDEGGCSRFFPIFPGGKPWENLMLGDANEKTDGGIADGENQEPSSASNLSPDLDSRFFPTFKYQAKPSRAERNAGTEVLGLREKQGGRPNSADPTGKFPDHDHRVSGGNNHPTVKSTALMSWLVRLVTPPGGTCLDPFLGSGSTGIACVKEGFGFIGIEREPDYMEIAKARIAHAIKEKLAEPVALDLDWGPAPEPESPAAPLPPATLF